MLTAKNSASPGTLGPVTQRIALLDVLRGVALLGILFWRPEAPYARARFRLQARIIHECVKESVLVQFEKSGHFPWLEQPRMFFSAVTDFLGRREAVR